MTGGHGAETIGPEGRYRRACGAGRASNDSLRPEVLSHESERQFGRLPTADSGMKLAFDAELVHSFFQSLAELGVVNSDALARDRRVQLAGVDELGRHVVFAQVVDRRYEL